MTKAYGVYYTINISVWAQKSEPGAGSKEKDRPEERDQKVLQETKPIRYLESISSGRPSKTKPVK